jgi:hypothetical protein
VVVRTASIEDVQRLAEARRRQAEHRGSVLS